MALAGYDEKTQELSLQFKSLGELGKDALKWREHTQTVLFYVLEQLSKLLEKNSENGILFRPYGSAAEDLKCIEPDDVGDVDIVIYPDSNNLMIHDELIEYLPENPMHVKIKGADHPLLKSCLVEDKEYVATSALKKFHPAIYGRSAPRIVDIITRAHQQIMLTPELSSLLQSTSYLKDKEASPAIAVNFTTSLNKQPSDASPYVHMEEWEWLIHFFCNKTGIFYTKEHAMVIDDITQFMNEVEMYLDNKRLNTVSEMLPAYIEFYQSDRAKVLQARFQSISNSQPRDRETQRKKNMESREISEKQHVLSGEQQRKEYNANLFQRKFSSCEWPCFKTEHCKEVQTNAGEFHSDGNRSGNGDCDAMDERSETKRSGDLVENHVSSKKEQLLILQKYQSPSQGETEAREKRILNLFFDHLFGSITEERENSFKEAANVPDFEKSSDHQQSGFDFVPAFKAPGWPMVAQEWIRRKRKWPSQEVIDQILQEGFHLVVKAPKNGGNLECDFRISFANAEFLLSKDLNEVQRECYRCLKIFHQAYLSTKPKSLVSFHLKNLFLQTVEETGAEMWTQSNRVECMMKLFRNLLEALRKRNLRHFFVRSYNLFSEDYIEDLNILEPLVGMCEKINENPMQFVRKLTQRQNSEQTKKEQNCLPALSTQGQSDLHKEVSSNGTEKECKEAINQESSSITSLRYHDLKDIFLSTCKEMTDLAFNEPHCGSLLSLHSLEKSIIEDLREIEKYEIIQVADFPKMFDICWDTAYYKTLISPEPNIRCRILDGIKVVLELCKYVLRQDDFATGNEEAIIQRMLDPSSKDSFDLNCILSAGSGSQFLRNLFRGEKVRPTQAPKVIQEDIPLD